jgi:hypothetical protein
MKKKNDSGEALMYGLFLINNIGNIKMANELASNISDYLYYVEKITMASAQKEILSKMIDVLREKGVKLARLPEIVNWVNETRYNTQ